MRARIFLVMLLAACVLAPASASTPSRPRVAIFFYPWYGTPAHDGEWEHWTQNGATPPRVIASNYYPVRGPYSSADPRVLNAQMREIARAGVDEVVTSWWGRGSREDERLPAIIAAARARGLVVGVHLEPYPKRSAQSVQADLRYVAGLGVHDVFVYEAELIPAEDWAAVLPQVQNVRVIAHTRLVGWAKRARFDGVYTFDGAPSIFRRVCAQARKAKLACAPTVSPGFDARRSTGNPNVQPRRNGATYDGRWHAAVCARPDLVTISSYNEWHEGTQIEPATASPPSRMYRTYDGAYGKHGPAAANAYLQRTLYWVRRFDRGRAC